jgi:hypothetical protein
MMTMEHALRSMILLAAIAACGGISTGCSGSNKEDGNLGDAAIGDGGENGSDATPIGADGSSMDRVIYPDAGTGPDAGADGGPTSLSGMSDQFEGTSLDPAWSVLHADTVDVSEHDGKLFIHPNTSILWYNDSEAVIVYKMVTGNFKATSAVHARRASDPTMPPDKIIHLGGVMGRDPTAPPENYVFVVVGHDENGIAVETKSTANSQSSYMGPTWPSGDAELRLCRLGASFNLYKRAIGSTVWQMAYQFNRPDLPATLEVGPNVYAYTGNNSGGGPPDLLVSYEYFNFADVADLAGCTAD